MRFWERMRRMKCKFCGKTVKSAPVFHTECWEKEVQAFAKEFCDKYCKFSDIYTSEEELEKRRAEWKPLPPRVTTGYLAKYASMVGTASHGARVVAKL